MTYRRLLSCFIIITAIGLTGCESGLFSKEETDLNDEQVAKLIPTRVKDRASWAKDIVAITDELKIPQDSQNMCTIIAVVDQESNFVADPVVPGLGAKAVKEINIRLQEKLGERMAGYFETMLKTKPTPDDNYLDQIKKVRTERELDQLYREMFKFYSQQYHVSLLTGAAKLVGQDVAENFNPITTLGSMQVHIHYARAHKRSMMGIDSLRDNLYTQNGGLYYGIHRLMMYKTEYSKPLYRFADYNSGVYSSRNASFQQMIEKITGKDLDLDGDLLIYNKDGDARLEKSTTEQVLVDYFASLPNAPSISRVRGDLSKEKLQEFEQTETYQFIKTLYKEKTGKDAPYAIMPEVVISGPKLNRDYNTNWFAERVNGRYTQCMQRAKRLKYHEE